MEGFVGYYINDTQHGSNKRNLWNTQQSLHHTKNNWNKQVLTRNIIQTAKAIEHANSGHEVQNKQKIN